MSMGFPRQECWSGLPWAPPGDLPDSGMELVSLNLLHWQADSLPLVLPEKPYVFSSAQWPVVSNPLWPHGLQHTKASLSITNSQSLFKFMSIESVMPSNHLILCHALLLLPSIFPSIKVFWNKSALRIRWPKKLKFQLQHQSFQGIFRTNFL